MLPCTEEYVTRRASKRGPAGTRIQINKNVDSDFYHYLFAETGGIFDLIEEKLPWLKGKDYFLFPLFGINRRRLRSRQP